MFCCQCQETARNTGCTVRGVCGKVENVAALQDLLIYTLKGISDIVIKDHVATELCGSLNIDVIESLFMTITNANFDEEAFESQIKKMIVARDGIRQSRDGLSDAATFRVSSRESMIEKAQSVGVLSTDNEDIQIGRASCRERG